MKKRILLIVLACLSLHVSAQVETHSIDSLKAVLGQVDLHPLERMKTHFELSNKYIELNVDSSMVHARTALELEKKHPDGEIRTDCLNQVALVFGDLEQNDSAFHYYELALASAREHNLEITEVVILGNLGTLFIQVHDPRAAKYIDESFAVAESLFKRSETDSTIKRSYIINAMGFNRYNRGALEVYNKNYQAATEFFETALIYTKQDESQWGTMYVYWELGIVFTRMGNDKEAIDMYESALAIALDEEAPKTAARLRTALAFNYTALGEFELAKLSLDSAWAHLEKDNQPADLTGYYSNLAHYYMGTDDYEAALEAYLQENKIAYARKYENQFVLNELQTVDCYIPLQRFEEARAAILRAEEHLKIYHTAEDESNILRRWIKFHKALGNVDSALNYSDQYIALKDSLVPDATVNQISEIYARLGAEKQQLALELAQKNEQIKTQEALAAQLETDRITMQRNYVIAGAVLLLTIVFIGYRIYNARRRDQVQKQLAHLELKALRAQINPHFLFNALSGVQNMIDKNELRSASVSLARCAKLTRLILEHSEKETVSLKDELHSIRLYIELEALRFNFKHVVKVEADIDQEEVEVPSMLIQPFIENAILHGISSKREEGLLTIKISQADQGILFAVEDNGVGRSNASQPKEHGHEPMGMKISKSRVSKLHADEEYDVESIITDLFSDDGIAIGTRVEVMVPIQDDVF